MIVMRNSTCHEAIVERRVRADVCIDSGYFHSAFAHNTKIAVSLLIKSSLASLESLIHYFSKSNQHAINQIIIALGLCPSIDYRRSNITRSLHLPWPCHDREYFFSKLIIVLKVEFSTSDVIVFLSIFFLSDFVSFLCTWCKFGNDIHTSLYNCVKE